jgi:hypothetical protein
MHDVGVAEEFTLILRRPRRCPRWMWSLSSTQPTVMVGDESHEAKWDFCRRYPGPAQGAPLRIEHVLSSPHGTWWTQKADAELVRPGEVVTYRASWWPLPRRRLTPQPAPPDVESMVGPIEPPPVSGGQQPAGDRAVFGSIWTAAVVYLLFFVDQETSEIGLPQTLLAIAWLIALVPLAIAVTRGTVRIVNRACIACGLGAATSIFDLGPVPGVGLRELLLHTALAGVTAAFAVRWSGLTGDGPRPSATL